MADSYLSPTKATPDTPDTTPDPPLHQSAESNQSISSIGHGKTDSMLSDGDETNETNEKDTIRSIVMDILTTENDLAGFSILWGIGFILVMILRISEHPDVVETSWQSIFGLPLLICTTTWVFSYIITIYRRPNSVESMKIAPFFLPFACKCIIATIFFWRLMWANGGIKSIAQDEGEFNGWCNCSMFVIWICLITTTVISEMIITTVMVNSAQNLQERVPKYVDAFLFITRPLLWVYNRLIIMFVTFYCYYYVIPVGPFCTNQCPVASVRKLEVIGLSTLTLPFHDLFYLFSWKPFDLNDDAYHNSHDVMYAVIQQVLIFTAIFDLMMDLWSVWRIFQREADLDFTKAFMTRSIRSASEFTSPFRKNSKSKPIPMRTIQESAAMRKNTNNNEEEEDNNDENDDEEGNDEKKEEEEQTGGDTQQPHTSQEQEGSDTELEYTMSEESDDHKPHYSAINSDSDMTAKRKEKENGVSFKPKLDPIASGKDSEV